MYDKFSNYHCKDEKLCPGGNCVGCKGGKLWCFDPKCFPHCNDCPYPKERDNLFNMVFVIMVLVLISVAILILVGFGSPIAYLFVPKDEIVPRNWGVEPISHPATSSSFELPPPAISSDVVMY